MALSVSWLCLRSRVVGAAFDSPLQSRVASLLGSMRRVGGVGSGGRRVGLLVWLAGARQPVRGFVPLHVLSERRRGVHRLDVAVVLLAIDEEAEEDRLDGRVVDAEPRVGDAEARDKAHEQRAVCVVDGTGEAGVRDGERHAGGADGRDGELDEREQEPLAGGEQRDLAGWSVPEGV